MLTTILSGLFLLAVGQGIFLGVALLGARPELRAANRLLTALLLVCVAVIGHAWLGIHHLYREYPHSALAVMPLGLAVGPLLYLYLGKMLFDRALGWRQLAHFAPFALATLALLPFYLQPAAAKLAWMLQRVSLPWYVSLAAAAKLAFFLCDIYACYRLIGRAGPGPLARGLRRLLAIWWVGGVLGVGAFAIEHAAVELPLSSDVVGALALLCFVYATAFLAIRMPLGYQPQPEPQQAPQAEPKPRYANSLLSDEDRHRFLVRLDAWMETAQPRDANFLFASDTPSSPSYGNLPGLNGYLEMQRLHEAGLSLVQLFKAATINNARAFGQASLGSIETGKAANLLLMKRSPLQDIGAYDSIVTVWIGGKQVARQRLAAGN
jgi:hypothetical protein